MPDIKRDAAARVSAALLGLPEEDQDRIGRTVANIINMSMDLAEQIAPILAKTMQTDPAA